MTPLPTAGNQPADAGRSGAVRAGDAPGGQGAAAPVIMSGDSLPAGVRQANFPQPVSDAASDAVLDDRMFASQSELQVEPLVSQIVARNPSIEAMSSAWQAASQRYPQVVSLDDPVLMSMIAPASFGSNLVSPAYVVGGSQKIPWLGKRAARGRVAQEEANAAMYDVQQTRLVVIEGARLAFYDYYLVRRELELNAANRSAMQQFRDTAKSRYESNLVTQQDVLQADVALAEVQRRQIELERLNRVAAARLNTLLLRSPEAYLPPPPELLSLGRDLPSAESLRSLATQRRPDLAALGAKMRAEQASVAVAAKEFYPDMEFYGRYDSFWQPAATQSQLRPQVGLNMNVPLYQSKRYAALHEAEFRYSQRRAEYQQRISDIGYEVQAAYEQLEQARQTALLYGQKFLPAAEQNVQVARTSYSVGKINFLGLIQAQQQLIMLREKQQEALADYYRRLAELERATGGDLPSGAGGSREEIPPPKAPAG